MQLEEFFVVTAIFHFVPELTDFTQTDSDPDLHPQQSTRVGEQQNGRPTLEARLDPPADRQVRAPGDELVEHPVHANITGPQARLVRQGLDDSVHDHRQPLDDAGLPVPRAEKREDRRAPRHRAQQTAGTAQHVRELAHSGAEESPQRVPQRSQQAEVHRRERQRVHADVQAG